MNFLTLKRLWIFWILFFIVPLKCLSQSQKVENFRPEYRDAFYNPTFWSFSILPYMVNKAKTVPASGSYRLNDLYMYGIETGFDYHINFNENYSLVFGIHGGAAGRNYRLFISKYDFTPHLEYDVIANGALTRTFDFYLSAPIWFKKKWFDKRNNYWNALAGVNVRYYPVAYENVVDQSADYQDSNGNQVIVAELDYSIGNNLSPWLNYNVGGGYSILLNNDNYLECNLLANFSDKKIVRGSYRINVSGKPQSFGRYSANLSYIGLSFSYIFTGANKRLKRLIGEKPE